MDKMSLNDDIYSESNSPRIGAGPCSPATIRPLALYTVSDVSQLMYDLGLGTVDVQRLRRHAIDGVALQSLSEPDMDYDLRLSPSAVLAVIQAQRAGRLFDRIARYSSQQRITELDLRVWLASSGLRMSAITRLADQFRTMAYADDGLVCFAELCMNFSWFDGVLRAAGAWA